MIFSIFRVESFCKAIVFTHRPVRVNEKIFIRFVDKAESWSGSIRFGFSSVDPRLLAGNLPKYACPDLTNKNGFWAKALSEKFADKDSVMYYYVSSGGDVVFGVNGEDKGVFFSGVDTRRQLWGMVDVYGNSHVIEMVDPRRTLNNIRSAQMVPRSPAPIRQHLHHPPPQQQQYQSLPHQHSQHQTPPPPPQQQQQQVRLRRSESCGRVSSGGDSPKKLARAAFHRACIGQNITLNQTATIAARSETEFCNGYVFLDSPMQPGESLTIRVLETEGTYIGSIAFGLTTADPKYIKTSELPEDSDLLTQRPEYWVHTKDVLPDPQDGDEISFTLSLDGTVLCSVNGGHQRVLFHTDISLTTRPFIDIYGVAQKIQILGVNPSQPSVTLRRSSRSNSNMTRPKSCSPDPNLVQTTECVICDIEMTGMCSSKICLWNFHNCCFVVITQCIRYNVHIKHCTAGLGSVCIM